MLYDISQTTRTDLSNLGGVIDAANSLSATAGRDINIASTTRDTASAQGKRTGIDRVAGLYITGTGGTLVASAGRDLNLDAATIANGLIESNPTAAGNTTLVAGRNLNLNTVLTSSSQAIIWNSANFRKESSRTEVGSTIQGKGNIEIAAGNNVSARAASISSSAGTLQIAAGNNIALVSGEATQSLDEGHQSTSKGFLSKKTTTTRDQVSQTTALASSLSAERISLAAGADIGIKGSNVVATNDVNLNAQNNVTLEAAITGTQESHLKVEKKSGLFTSGGLGITIGTQQLSVDQQATSETAAASTVGSNQGNVNINAGKNFKQVGSSIIAPVGDINVNAQKVDIREAQARAQSTTETKFKQSGLTLALTSPVISAIQTAQQQLQVSKDTKDPRLKLLAAATTAVAAVNAADAISAGQGTRINGQDGQIFTGRDEAGNVTSRDANAADQAGGVNLSISIGASQSKSKTTQNSSTAQGSTLAAGRDINIRATGADKDSDLTIQGSKVTAGRDIKLVADNNINLLAAQSTADQKSTNSSSSGSVGISIGTGGFGITVSASGARGKSDGNDVTQVNTQVSAARQLRLDSAADTNLKGAVVTGKQVVAQVGGDLNIESLQDISQFASKQQSLGASVTIGVGVSASINASQSNSNSDFATVTEQSGIKAGEDGFQITVKGNTRLKGGEIASTDKAVAEAKNKLETATLSAIDVQNRANFKARSTALGGGFSSSSGGLGTDQQGRVQSGAQQTPGTTLPGLNGFSASLPVSLSAKGSAASTTRSGVSGAAITITDAAQQQALTGQDAATTVASLNREVSTERDTSNTLTPIFNEKEIQAGFAIVSAFAREVGTFLNNQAQSAATKNIQATSAEQQAQDPNLSNEQRLALLQQAQGFKTEAKAITDNWGPGGTYRQITTALVGAASGNVTGTSSAFIQSAAVNYLQSLGAKEVKKIADALDSESARAALQGVLACGGAAAQGASCSAGATGAATSVVLNNLIDRIEGSDVSTLTAQERQARTNIVASLVAGITTASGSDAAIAAAAAQIETENNALNFIKGTTPRIRAVGTTIADVLGKPKGQITRQELDSELAKVRAAYASGDLSLQETLNLNSLGLAVLTRGSNEGLLTPEEITATKEFFRAAIVSLAFSGGGNTSVKSFGSATGPVLPGTSSPFVGKGQAGIANSEAQNIVNAQKLAKDLEFQVASSPFTTNGRLTQDAINNAKSVPELGPGQLNNPAIPPGFGKYTTDTFRSPAGDFKVHFYKNPTTGEVLYSLDYKAVFNRMSGVPKKP